MTIKDLKQSIANLPDDTVVLVSSDEELNNLYEGWQVAELSDKKKTIVIYGLDGTEVE